MKIATAIWRSPSRTEVKPDKKGTVKFRGFSGKYKITWKDNSGNIQTREYYLK